MAVGNSNKACCSRDLNDDNDSEVITAAPVTMSTKGTGSLPNNSDNERLQGPLGKSIEMVQSMELKD